MKWKKNQEKINKLKIIYEKLFHFVFQTRRIRFVLRFFDAGREIKKTLII